MAHDRNKNYRRPMPLFCREVFTCLTVFWLLAAAVLARSITGRFLVDPSPDAAGDLDALAIPVGGLCLAVGGVAANLLMLARRQVGIWIGSCVVVLWAGSVLVAVVMLGPVLTKICIVAVNLVAVVAYCMAIRECLMFLNYEATRSRKSRTELTLGELLEKKNPSVAIPRQSATALLSVAAGAFAFLAFAISLLITFFGCENNLLVILEKAPWTLELLSLSVRVGILTVAVSLFSIVWICSHRHEARGTPTAVIGGFLGVMPVVTVLVLH